VNFGKSSGGEAANDLKEPAATKMAKKQNLINWHLAVSQQVSSITRMYYATMECFAVKISALDPHGVGLACPTISGAMM